MSLKEIQRFQIPVKYCYPVHSLCWQGNELVDWVGGKRYKLDGSGKEIVSAQGGFFDAAVASPDGKYAVIYGRLGTKGLILKEGKLLREINRSYYRADDYEYPIALFTLPDGRAVIVHCPEHYNELEIEEVETGRRLTPVRTNREAVDYFYSRLQTSADGKYLLSAGWVWLPMDVIEVFSVEWLLNSSTILEGAAVLPTIPDELSSALFSSAAFLNESTILVAGGGEGPEAKNSLAAYNLTTGKIEMSCDLEDKPGTIMPIGKDYVIGFYGHPKLFDTATGKVVQRWPELHSGKQFTSIIHNVCELPPLALDPERKRFAVADEKQITVIQLG